MLSTTPPLAVPSSLVTTRPVTPKPLLNCSACATAFCPMVPSRINSTSCGAAGSSLASTRLIFFSSSMRWVCVCSRPAVSAIKTSMRRARAACKASTMTAAGSAPALLATIRAPRARRVQGGKNDPRRFGARLARDDRHAVALGPNLELLARRCAKGVPRGEHDAASFGQKPMRQLADGGRLACAVDADDQNDVGLDRLIDHERPFHRLQNIDHGLAQGLEQRIDVVEFLAGNPAAQAVENAGRGLHAHIGGDEPRFQIIENLSIDLSARQQFRDVGGEPRGPHVQLGAQALEEAAGAWFIRFVRHGGELSRAIAGASFEGTREGTRYDGIGDYQTR